MPTVKPAHPDEPLITLSIHAFVIDEIGEPVSGAKVTLFRNSDPVASESSDANGTAQFKDLALTRGIHILEAAKGDYVSEKQQLVVGSDMASSTQWIIFRLEEIEPPPVWRPLSAQYTPQKAREGPPHVLREPTVGVLHEPIRKERPADRLGDVKERWEGADAGEEEELVEEELNDLEPSSRQKLLLRQETVSLLQSSARKNSILEFEFTLRPTASQRERSILVINGPLTAHCL
jgi:hypothetical protein